MKNVQAQLTLPDRQVVVAQCWDCHPPPQWHTQVRPAHSERTSRGRTTSEPPTTEIELIKIAFKISNGYSRANLANLSTRVKLAVFGECEYSPKWPFSEICKTCQTRRHSPSRVARTRQTRRHSPSRVGRTRQTRQHSPSRVARTRQTRRHSPKAIFEKNVTRLDKFARVTRESREFGASGHCLIQNQEKYSLSFKIQIHKLPLGDGKFEHFQIIN
jgi:hypothetical protein